MQDRTAAAAPTTAKPGADQARPAPRLTPLRLMLARWPSVFGLLAMLSNTVGGTDPHLVAMIIIAAAGCYLAAACVGMRRAGWIMFGISIVVLLASGLMGVDKTVALLVMGVAFLVLGFLRPREERAELALQGGAFVVFSGIGVTVMMSAPLLAAYLAAVAAIGHAGWDVIHFLRDKVVDRSLAEFCFILDLGLGIALLLTAWGVLPW